MNDEIKYWLEGLDELSFNKVLDYITNLEDTLIDKQECIDAYNEIINNRDKKITNLQQKEELLRQEISDVRKAFNGLQQENERLNKEFVFVGTAQNKTREFIKNIIKEKNDYKSRCEKAISKTKDLYSYADNEEYVDNYCKDLLNILQNGGDSQ